MEVTQILAIDNKRWIVDGEVEICMAGDSRHVWKPGDINKAGFTIESEMKACHGFECVIKSPGFHGDRYFLANLIGRK